MCPQLMSAWAVADWGAKSQAGCGWRAMDDAPRRAPSGLQRFEGRSGSMGFGPVGSMGRAPPPCPCTAPCTRSMSSWRPKAFLAFLASVATAPSASAGGAENSFIGAVRATFKRKIFVRFKSKRERALSPPRSRRARVPLSPPPAARTCPAAAARPYRPPTAALPPPPPAGSPSYAPCPPPAPAAEALA